MTHILLNSISLLLLFQAITADLKETVHDFGHSEGIIHKTIDYGPNGKSIIKTKILINGSTTREEIINGCRLLQMDGISLTFEKLTIRKTVFGVLGEPRISYARGTIKMPDGTSENFEVGGKFNLKIYYSEIERSGNFTLEMVEIID